MKKVGDLFAELGFRPDASDGVKRAFIENLVRAAGSTVKLDARAEDIKSEARSPVSRPEKPRLKSPKTDPQQLSFELSFDLDEQSNAKRRSS